MSERIVPIPAESDLIAVRVSIPNAAADTVLRPMGSYSVWVREEAGGPLKGADLSDKRSLRVGKREFREFFFFKRTVLTVHFGIGQYDIPAGVPKFRLRGTANFEIVNPVRLASAPHGECWVHAGEMALLYGYRSDPQGAEHGLACALRGPILERLKREAASVAADHSRENIERIVFGEDHWTQYGAETRPVLGETLFEPLERT